MRFMGREEKATGGAEAAQERNSGQAESRDKGCGSQSPGQSPCSDDNARVQSLLTLSWTDISSS